AKVERTDTNLYVCFTGLDSRVAPSFDTLPPPNDGDAVTVLVDISDTLGASTTEGDYYFRVKPSGTFGYSGAGFGGPDPGGWAGAQKDLVNFEDLPLAVSAKWEAAFSISKATLGGDWSKTIGFALLASDPGQTGKWPAGFEVLLPYTWGE